MPSGPLNYFMRELGKMVKSLMLRCSCYCTKMRRNRTVAVLWCSGLKNLPKEKHVLQEGKIEDGEKETLVHHYYSLVNGSRTYVHAYAYVHARTYTYTYAHSQCTMRCLSKPPTPRINVRPVYDYKCPAKPQKQNSHMTNAISRRSTYPKTSMN